MTLPFLNSKKVKPDQIVGVDLGSRTTKAVLLRATGGKFVLSDYVVIDSPVHEKGTIPTSLLSEHLKSVLGGFDRRVRSIAVAVGNANVVVRHVEMPDMPLNDVRMVLKNNSRKYLQQELTDHVFDCHPVYKAVPVGLAQGNRLNANGHKQRLIAAGAKRQLVDDLMSASNAAGLRLLHLTPGTICTINAFEQALPEVYASEVVALVEIGFRCTTVCILQQGDMVLNRVVNIGGDHITAALAEGMGITNAEAEGIKVGMPHEVNDQLANILSQLGCELRASIDFFEHQQERTVACVYMSGGTSESPAIREALAAELMVKCATWNPAQSLQPELAPSLLAELEQVAARLGVAIGAAVGAL